MKKEIESIVELVDKVAQDENFLISVAEVLKKTSDFSDELKTPIVTAFMYYYVERQDSETRNLWGVYAPFMVLADGRVSNLPLQSLTEEHLETLDNVAALSRLAKIRSRIYDILWIKKFSSSPYLYAQKAIDDFLSVAEDEEEVIFRRNCLSRAQELAREINDQEKLTGVIEASIVAIRRSLEEPQPQPGMSLGLIENLISLPEIPDKVKGLLNLALQTYDSPWEIESILEMKIRLESDEDIIKEHRATQIDAWVNEAKKAEALHKLFHYQKALELARTHGIREKVDEILVAIQSVSDEDLNLNEVAVSVDIPIDEVQKFHNWFFLEDTWQSVLTRFATYGIPSGDYEGNLKSVDKIREKNPIQFLVTGIIRGEDNVPIFIAQTESDHERLQLSRQEMIGIDIFSISAIEILRIFKEKYEDIAVEDLIGFFSTSLISEEVAVKIAKAFEYYFSGEYDTALHIVIPRIETIIRNMSRDLGLPIIQEPINGRPGGVLSLGKLFQHLYNKMDESIRRYLYTLLSNPIGKNIRNRVAHGLDIHNPQIDAVLVLHAICLLRILEVHQEPINA